MRESCPSAVQRVQDRLLVDHRLGLNRARLDLPVFEDLGRQALAPELVVEVHLDVHLVVHQPLKRSQCHQARESLHCPWCCWRLVVDRDRRRQKSGYSATGRC